MDSQHWIARVEDSTNDYIEVQSAYFDGSERDAAEYFGSTRCPAINRYMGRIRYSIYMQANPITLQWPTI